MSMTSFLGGIQNDPNFSERLERIEQKLDLLLEQKSDLYECVHSSDILDVVDVASICKVAPRTIYNWVYAGKLTCFKDLKAEKEFKYVPKPNSPDAEKIAYVQAHGAQGVNDIWEMGGVNLERDSFLDKYDVEGFYKDYLSANQDKDQARAKELSESIQNNVSRQESLGISR